MKRREVIKGLAAFGVLAFLPDITAIGKQAKSNLHFVGLGQGGTNAMVHIHGKGVVAKYSCITGPYVSHLKPEMEHLYFRNHSDYRIKGIHYKKPLDLTPEMKAIFRESHRYVILTGLGSSVGTGFIRSLLDFMNLERKNYIAICSLPPKCEGRSKRNYATQKKSEIEGFANVIFFDNELIDNDYLPVKKRFEMGNELFYQLFMENNKFKASLKLIPGLNWTMPF
jgi:cell division GTPase FtsZ